MNESTERMIQAIVGISHEPLIALDKSLTIVSANQAFGKMFTVPEDKVTGETIYNLGCNQFDTSDFRRFIDLALSQDTIDGYELDHAFPSSEIRKLHLNTRLLHTEPENGQILLISLADGSGKESGADARLHLERVINFNKAMLAAIPTPVFYKDTQGRYLGCNNAFTEFTGVSDAQIKGKSVEELWPDEYAKVYHKTDMEILDNPARLVYEFKMRDMHGEARQVIYVKDVFRDENEQIAGIVGAFVDITERERTKEILLENEERFRRIFEEGPIGMVINDLDFRFSQVNSAFCKMLGYSQDELLRLTFKDITQPEHVSIDVAHLEKLIAGEIPVYKTEKHYLRKDKKEIWCSTTATAVHDKNGNCIYMLTMIEDITDRKTHEAAIIKLNAELEERVASRTSELKIANEQLGHEIAEKEAAGKILMSQRDINEKFRDMTEMTSDWLWEINTEGAYTYVSFKIRDILGYEPEEVLGKTPFDFMSPEEIKRVGPVFESYVTQNKPFSLLVNTNIHKDGHLVVLETNGVPIFDENHVLRGYRGIDRDITERKAAENVLRESEEKFRILFESSRDAIMIMGDDGYCIDCNSATENMYGYTREEFRKLNPWAVSPEFQDDGTSSKQAAMENNRKALAGETTKFEWINIRKDGTCFNAEAMLSPMDLNGKNVIQIIIRDITERKTAETALLKSEEKFRNLFESSRDSLMILDDGHFIDCNSATVKMFGYTVQEFCEISPWDVSPEFQEDGTPSKQAAMKKIQKALLDEMPTFEWIHRRKDSTDFNAEVTLSSVEMHGKKVVQALVRDITERKTAETALRESEEKFRNLFETSRDAIMILGDGRFIECNPATLHMFGYTEREFLKMSPWDVSPEFQEDGTLSKQSAMEKIQKAMTSEMPTFEWTHMRKDGTPFYAEVMLSPMELHGKKIVQARVMQLIVRDVTKHKEAEEILLESEKKFRNLFENSSDAIMILDETGQILECNPATAKMFGYSKEEFIGTSPWNISPEFQKDGTSSKQTAMDKIKQAWAGKTTTFEWINRCKNGTDFNAEVTLLPMELYGKKAVQAIVRDITERLAAEELIQREKTFVEGMIDGLPSPTVLLDRAGRYIAWNKAHNELLAMSDEEIGNQNALSVMYKEDQLFLEQKLKEVLETGKATSEVRLKTAKGLRYFYLTAKTVTVNGQELILTSGLDVSAKKYAEDVIKRTSAEWQLTFDAIPELLFILDTDSRIVRANRALLTELGADISEILGKKCSELGHLSAACPDYSFSEAPASTNRSVQLDNKEFMVTTSPIIDKSGKATGVVCMAKDITDIKKAEQKMQEALEIKSQFISIASHELRTPLTAIKESIAIVHDEIADKLSAEQLSFLDIAKRNIDRLARLINNILDFQKLESGSVKFRIQSCDINELIREVYGTMEPVSRLKNIHLNLLLTQDLPTVLCDRDRITQVLTNLLNNAIKFTELGSASCSTALKNDCILVSVTDTGPGISEKDLPKLFEKFGQVGANKPGGTGLGLAISKQIIEQHGGKMWVESKFGSGTAFHFTLPLA